jgi:hypothetical protein
MDEYELIAARQDPTALIAAFTETARGLIARGAEVIVPAEGVMAEIFARAGLRQIDKAVVLDVFAAAWCQALSLIRLRKGLGIGVAGPGPTAAADHRQHFREKHRCPPLQPSSGTISPACAPGRLMPISAKKR